MKTTIVNSNSDLTDQSMKKLQVQKTQPELRMEILKVVDLYIWWFGLQKMEAECPCL
jgi:hypothetical protein